MLTIAQKIEAGFELARQITEAAWMKGVDPEKLSIDELRDHISEMFDVEIEVKLLDVEVKAVYGFIMRYEGGKRACVYIAKNIPPRWKRLVGVKELCHVVVDVAEDWNPNGVDTLQRLMTWTVDLDAAENLAVRSEHIAEMVALELIYPLESRRDDITNGEKTDQIAAKYKLPENVVQMVLQPAYLASCDKYWRAVDDARRAKVSAENADNRAARALAKAAAEAAEQAAE